jgi:hypothetical protein
VYAATAAAAAQDLSAPPPPAGENPTRVLVEVNVNKIFAISELNETYVLDGYLTAQWMDSRNPKPKYSKTAYLDYLDDNAESVLGSSIWWPYFEFINTTGIREVQNRRLRVYRDGRVIYTERFRATFTSEMDFGRYPFDRQYFSVAIESYPYDTGSVIFENGEHADNQLEPIVEWDVEEPRSRIESRCFEDLEGRQQYSRYTLVVEAQRRPDYFYYQFFLPLLLIISSSWIVFWLRSLSDQLTIAFTLMLTVVAFNFFTSTLLPRLPYNTFIENAVLSGYVSIFAAIVAVVIHHATAARFGRVSDVLFRACRWLFPVVYFGIAILVFYYMIYLPDPVEPVPILGCGVN